MLGEWIGFKTVSPDLVVDFNGQKNLMFGSSGFRA